MQSLEEMIALFYLISISSLFLPCAFLLVPFSPLLLLHSFSVPIHICIWLKCIPLAKYAPVFTSTIPEVTAPLCHLGESLSLCI